MTEQFVYQPDPRVCSSRIELELEGDMIRKAVIADGCPGNLQALCKLVQNRTADEVISLLKGIKCGGKPTSCPDQLAAALQAYKNQKRNQ